MEKTEELKLRAAAHATGVSALGNERFEEKWLPIIQMNYNVTYFPKLNKYVIEKESSIIERYHYFPKSNKLLIQHRNQWINSAALRWLINNLTLSLY